MTRHRPALPATALLGLLVSASALAQTTVTLLDPGSEPRRELRYDFEQGYTQQGAMEMAIQLGVDMGGLQMPMNMPAIRMDMTMNTAEVADDGSARFEYEYTSAEVVGDAGNPLGAALGSALSQINGVSGWVRVDPRGTTLEAGFGAPGANAQQLAQVLDSAEQSIQQMSAPWPAEPVGVGAQWQAVTSFESGGFTLEQTATYTLESFDGNGVNVSVDLSQMAGEQALDGAAGLPPGAQVSLMSMESTGSGSMQVDLGALIPASEMSMSTAMTMSVAMQGQSQQMSMNVQTDISMSPGGGAP